MIRADYALTLFTMLCHACCLLFCSCGWLGLTGPILVEPASAASFYAFRKLSRRPPPCLNRRRRRRSSGFGENYLPRGRGTPLRRQQERSALRWLPSDTGTSQEHFPRSKPPFFGTKGMINLASLAIVIVCRCTLPGRVTVPVPSPPKIRSLPLIRERPSGRWHP